VISIKVKILRTLGSTLIAATNIVNINNKSMSIHWISSRWRPIRGGPPAWVLGERPKNLHRKSQLVMKCFTGPRTFGMHKRRVISWLAEWLSASQEWLCSMMSVTRWQRIKWRRKNEIPEAKHTLIFWWHPPFLQDMKLNFCEMLVFNFEVNWTELNLVNFNCLGM
jgi:hypothetical protein